MQDQSPYGIFASKGGTWEVKSNFPVDKLNQALKALGSYVNEAEPADGLHNDEVVDKAYKLLQEVVGNGVSQ